MTPWLLLAAVFFLGFLVAVSILVHRRGLRVGLAEGFQRGMAFAEEALLEEEESIALLCQTLHTTREELGPMLAASLERIETQDDGPEERPEVTR